MSIVDKMLSVFNSSGNTVSSEMLSRHISMSPPPPAPSPLPPSRVSIVPSAASSTLFGFAPSKEKEPSEPCQIVPMQDREGYVLCKECVYCDGVSAGQWCCVKDSRNGSVVHHKDGCFGGKKLPESLVVTHKLMDTENKSFDAGCDTTGP